MQPPKHQMTRRTALGTIGGLGAALILAACGEDNDGATNSSGGSADTTTNGSGATSTTGVTSPGPDATCSTIPAETAGPFPGDGTNGPNVRAMNGVVRPDIRSSIGDASGVADGVECDFEFTIIGSESCAALPGAAVYAWHCDATGRYSMYSDGVTEENWLRGIQVADSDGVVRFTSIFPGCYPGRWPHVHFEVYDDLAAATGSGTPIATSQLAFPAADCEAAFADERYGSSASNLERLSLETDNVFSDDGGVHQLATMTGSASRGYVAALRVAV